MGVEELDALLGTERWKVKAEETEKQPSMDKLETKVKTMKGRKGLQTSHLPGGMGEHNKAEAILAGSERGATGMVGLAMSLLSMEYGVWKSPVDTILMHSFDVRK